MKYNSLLENWNKFLNEQEAVDLSAITDPAKMTQQSVDAVKAVQKAQDKDISPQEKRENSIRKAVTSGLTAVYNSMQTAEKEADVTKDDIKKRLIDAIQQLEEAKKKKAGDRCTRIAKRKYDVWPSAYASGAVVKCRQGKIWKGISESATDEEIDYALLLEEVEETNIIEEKWSEKYKRSINCKNPKGFSQKAHCQGRKKNEELELDDELVEEAKKKDYKPNFSKEKEQGLHGWFARNDGKGWVNCRTGGPCGRDSADKGGKYPACRPTKAQCKSAGKGPLRKKKSSKAISWTKKKKRTN